MYCAFLQLSVSEELEPQLYINSGPVHMIPGQLIAPGPLTDPGVIFVPVVQYRCTTPGCPPCRSNFSPCEQNANVAPGQE